MTVDVIVPFVATSEERTRAWAWVRARYERLHPEWNVIVGTASATPWSKANAVADALERSDADTLIVADADVWVDDLAPYVEQVERCERPWACPQRRVFRFNRFATDRILDGADPIDVAWTQGSLDQSPYNRTLGGGLVVLRRVLYDACPLDPRFEGWGGEDAAWGFALCTMGGKRLQGEEPIWHLWHPPADRLNRRIGSAVSERLRSEYQSAAGNVEATEALIEQGRMWASKISSSPR